MIESLSTAAVPAGIEPNQPAPARSLAERPAGESLRGFGERMQQAAAQSVASVETETLLDAEQTLPEQAALPLAESLPEGESGLLEIIERQLADLQAREEVLSEITAELPMPVAVTAVELPELPGQAALASGLLPVAAPVVTDAADELPQDAPAPLRPAAVSVPSTAPRSVAQEAPAPVASETPAAAPASAAPLLSTPAETRAPGVSSELPISELAARDGSEPVVTDRQQAAPASSADRTLHLQAPQARWGEQMVNALRENVDLQVQQKIQNATIRLDPPELGSLEILLSHESGRLNVHLSAANVEVARLLQQTSDRLRQELVAQHFVQVNVQVGSDGGGDPRQQRQSAELAEDAPRAALSVEQPEQDARSTRQRDVLVTV